MEKVTEKMKDSMECRYGQHKLCKEKCDCTCHELMNYIDFIAKQG
ncbi:hypothetical protein OAJ50_03995 [Candidatus Nitrosopelagicus sp.]|nr:hypothetical protein [Candidatus Nitrosopelagicus sp.]